MADSMIPYSLLAVSLYATDESIIVVEQVSSIIVMN